MITSTPPPHAQVLDAHHAGGPEAMIRITPEKIVSWGLAAPPPHLD